LQFAINTGRIINRLPVVKPVTSASFEKPTTSPYLKGVTVVNSIGKIQKVKRIAATVKIIKISC
jgi:hypothetical protein